MPYLRPFEQKMVAPELDPRPHVQMLCLFQGAHRCLSGSLVHLPLAPKAHHTDRLWEMTTLMSSSFYCFQQSLQTDPTLISRTELQVLVNKCGEVPI